MAAPEVTTLSLSLPLDGDWDLAALLLGSLPRLRSVELLNNRCPPRILALLAALPDLEELVAPSLVLPDVDEKVADDAMTVGEALGRLGRLRSLRLGTCRPEALAVLADLPELRRLDVGVTVRGMSYYDSPQRREAAMETFKLRRPDVEGNIFKVDSYWSHRSQ